MTEIEQQPEHAKQPYERTGAPAHRRFREAHPR